MNNDSGKSVGKKDGRRSFDCAYLDVHGHAYGHAQEHQHQDLLATSAGKRKTEKSNPDRRHEKALDDASTGPVPVRATASIRGCPMPPSLVNDRAMRDAIAEASFVRYSGSLRLMRSGQSCRRRSRRFLRLQRLKLTLAGVASLALSVSCPGSGWCHFRQTRLGMYSSRY